jgi:hypothetical protein
VSDDKIRNYFLGKLDVPEAEDFEEKTAADSVLTEHAQMIESELIEDFLRGGLSTSEQNSFENNYLTTSARQQKLSLARIFLQNINEKPQFSLHSNSKSLLPPHFYCLPQLQVSFSCVQIPETKSSNNKRRIRLRRLKLQIRQIVTLQIQTRTRNKRIKIPFPKNRQIQTNRNPKPNLHRRQRPKNRNRFNRHLPLSRFCPELCEAAANNLLKSRPKPLTST